MRLQKYVAPRLIAGSLGLLWALAGCGENHGKEPAHSNEGDDDESPGDEGGDAGTDGGSGQAESDGGSENGDGSAVEAGAPGCSEDEDCTPENDCWSATCEAGTCVQGPRPRGLSCAGGFCNGFGWCLPCIDQESGAGHDFGCSVDQPACVESLEAACVGCREHIECDDGIECSRDRCSDGTCEHAPVAAGTPCLFGVCSGASDAASCVACIDDESTGLDTGCTPDAPICNTEVTPSACLGCSEASDCADGNGCTADRCTAGACENTTLPGGTPCAEGYCNGIVGREVCVTRRCLADEDCDDGADCTTDSCSDSSLCVYEADHAQCEDSGEVCRPNQCTVGTGCQLVDRSRRFELLLNGNLDEGNVAWTEESVNYDQVVFVYGYVPTLQPHSAEFIAWLGGGEGLLDEYNSLTQTVRVPPRTATLELSFYYQVWPEDGLPESQNQMTVNLLPEDGEASVEPIVVLYNQDDTRVWTRFATTIDAGALAGSEAVLQFSGTGVGGYTHFFVDSISLVATVCE